MVGTFPQGLRDDEPAGDQSRAVWAVFPLLFAGLTALILFSATGWSLLIDPYWAFRADPPWLKATQGANRLLDTEDRRAKPLQFVTRTTPDTVLVGSSVVYRGIDPDDLSPESGRAFNFGLSALMSYELPTLARLIAAKPSPRTVVIGLDYFAFTNFPVHVRVAPNLDTWTGRMALVTSSVLSWTSVSSARSGYLAQTYEPGGWKPNGFRHTPDRSASATLEENRIQAVNLRGFDPTLVLHLTGALTTLRDRRVILYLTPLSKAQRRIFAQKGRSEDWERWREAMTATARTMDVPLHDLSHTPQFDDFDPAQGSSRYWYDNLHFKPIVGRWVLQRIGLARP
ncbi:hypothetical protein [Microvirga terricola]|uniref:SGNH/GDSL hydrolase family protein n=1 Tax=Microvirga terricola TaxID=2719797 RepID=A0ABX0VCV9_9HYPH|nr:hypothetical protein [Microvirga terricola]NIX75672.1 hypothetical protein [Microvirga terricola]